MKIKKPYGAQFIECSDLHPFGMHAGNYSVNKYRYSFNSKEQDDEIIDRGRWQDYGVRIYRPDLALTVVDIAPSSI